MTRRITCRSENAAKGILHSEEAFCLRVGDSGQFAHNRVPAEFYTSVAPLYLCGGTDTASRTKTYISIYVCLGVYIHIGAPPTQGPGCRGFAAGMLLTQAERRPLKGPRLPRWGPSRAPVAEHHQIKRLLWNSCAEHYGLIAFDCCDGRAPSSCENWRFNQHPTAAMVAVGSNSGRLDREDVRWKGKLMEASRESLQRQWLARLLLLQHPLTEAQQKLLHVLQEKPMQLQQESLPSMHYANELVDRTATEVQWKATAATLREVSAILVSLAALGHRTSAVYIHLTYRLTQLILDSDEEQVQQEQKTLEKEHMHQEQKNPEEEHMQQEQKKLEEEQMQQREVLHRAEQFAAAGKALAAVEHLDLPAARAVSDTAFFVSSYLRLQQQYQREHESKHSDEAVQQQRLLLCARLLHQLLAKGPCSLPQHSLASSLQALRSLTPLLLERQQQQLQKQHWLLRQLRIRWATACAAPSVVAGLKPKAFVLLLCVTADCAAVPAVAEGHCGDGELTEGEHEEHTFTSTKTADAAAGELSLLLQLLQALQRAPLLQQMAHAAPQVRRQQLQLLEETLQQAAAAFGICAAAGEPRCTQQQHQQQADAAQEPTALLSTSMLLQHALQLARARLAFVSFYKKLPCKSLTDSVSMQ
ncbi:hypothetical protein cyc_01380 [Cyclospora cayetanensis]|uniref:Uncharacterized protein n=1 Tax=Cyclospora cayetanensis TaxID=88456 RepID=A0A1D3CXX3_9EIME|nr:hypothetical protein cyc_01380 [Cyclospora cayetanensis]